jgi:uncharacterized MAPEG superfamily protein
VAKEQAKMPEGYDNAMPRDQQARLSPVGRRAQGAHMNGFEAFAPFAAGILACRVANVDLTATVILGAIFVIARAIYVFLYLTDRPSARSFVWSIGFLATCALLLYPVFRHGW